MEDMKQTSGALTLVPLPLHPHLLLLLPLPPPPYPPPLLLHLLWWILGIPPQEDPKKLGEYYEHFQF